MGLKFGSLLVAQTLSAPKGNNAIYLVGEAEPVGSAAGIPQKTRAKGVVCRITHSGEAKKGWTLDPGTQAKLAYRSEGLSLSDATTEVKPDSIAYTDVQLAKAKYSYVAFEFNYDSRVFCTKPGRAPLTRDEVQKALGGFIQLRPLPEAEVVAKEIANRNLRLKEARAGDILETAFSKMLQKKNLFSEIIVPDEKGGIAAVPSSSGYRDPFLFKYYKISGPQEYYQKLADVVLPAVESGLGSGQKINRAIFLKELSGLGDSGNGTVSYSTIAFALYWAVEKGG